MAQGHTEELSIMGVNCADQLFRDIPGPKTMTNIGKDPAAITAAVMDKFLPIGDDGFVGREADIAVPGLGAKAFSCIDDESEKIGTIVTGLGSYPDQTMDGPDAGIAPSTGNLLPRSSAAMSATALLQKLNRDLQNKRNPGSNLRSWGASKARTKTAMPSSTVAKGQEMVTLTLEPVVNTSSPPKRAVDWSQFRHGLSGAGLRNVQFPSSPNTSSFIPMTGSVTECVSTSLKPPCLSQVSPKELKITAQRSSQKSYSDGKNLWKFMPGTARKVPISNRTTDTDKSLWKLAETIQKIPQTKKRKHCTVSDYYIRYLNRPKRARHEAFKIIFKTKAAELDLTDSRQVEIAPERPHQRTWPHDKSVLPGCTLAGRDRATVFKATNRREKSSALSTYRVAKPKRKSRCIASHATPCFPPKKKKIIHTNQNLASLFSKFVPMSQLKWNPVLNKFVRQAASSVGGFSKKFTKSQCFSFPSESVGNSVKHKSLQGKSNYPLIAGTSVQNKNFFVPSSRLAGFSKTVQNALKVPHRTPHALHKCKDIKFVLECRNVPQPNFAMTLADYVKICVIFQVRKLLAAKSLASGQSDNAPQKRSTLPENASDKKPEVAQSAKLMTSLVLISSLTEQVLLDWSKNLPQASCIDPVFKAMLGRLDETRKRDKKICSGAKLQVMSNIYGNWLRVHGNPVQPVTCPGDKNDPSDRESVLSRDAYNAWRYDSVDNEVWDPKYTTPAMSPQKISPLIHKPWRFSSKDERYPTKVTHGSLVVAKENVPSVRTLRSQSQSRTLSREEPYVRKRNPCCAKLSYCVRFRQHLVTDKTLFETGPAWKACENMDIFRPWGIVCSMAATVGNQEANVGVVPIRNHRGKKFDNIFEAMGAQNGYGTLSPMENDHTVLPGSRSPLLHHDRTSSSKWDRSTAGTIVAVDEIIPPCLSPPRISSTDRPCSLRSLSADSFLGDYKANFVRPKKQFVNGFHKKSPNKSCIVQGEMEFRRKIGNTEIFHVKGVRRFSTPEKFLRHSFNVSPPDSTGRFVRKISGTEIFHKCVVKKRLPPLEEIDVSKLEKIYGRGIEELARIAWLEDSLLSIEEKSQNCDITIPQNREGSSAVAPTFIRLNAVTEAVSCHLNSARPVLESLPRNCLYSLCQRQMSALSICENERRKATGIASSNNERGKGCEMKKKATCANSTHVNNRRDPSEHDTKEGNSLTQLSTEAQHTETRKPTTEIESCPQGCNNSVIGASTISNFQNVSQAEQTLSYFETSANGVQIGSVCSEEMGNLFFKKKAPFDEQHLVCKSGDVISSSESTPGRYGHKAGPKCQEALVNGDAVGSETNLSCLFGSRNVQKECSQGAGPVPVERDTISTDSLQAEPNLTEDIETIPPSLKEEPEKDCSDISEIRSSHRLRSKRVGKKRGRYEDDYVTDLPKSKKPKKALPCRDYDEDMFWQFYRDCQKSEHVKNLILQHKYIKLLKSKQIECQVQPLFNGLYSQFSNVTCAKSYLTMQEHVLTGNGIIPAMLRFTKGRRGPPEVLKPTTDGVCPYCGRTYEADAKEAFAAHMERHKMRSTILSVPHVPKKSKKKKVKNPALRPVKPAPTKPTVVFVEPESSLHKKPLANATTLERLGLIAAQSLPFSPAANLITPAGQASLEQLKNIKAFPRPTNISMGHRKQTARKSHSYLAANLSREKLIAALASKANSSSDNSLKSPARPLKSTVPASLPRDGERTAKVGDSVNSHSLKKKVSNPACTNPKSTQSSTKNSVPLTKMPNAKSVATKPAYKQGKSTCHSPKSGQSTEKKTLNTQPGSTRKTHPNRVTVVHKKTPIGLCKYAKTGSAIPKVAAKSCTAAGKPDNAPSSPAYVCKTIETRLKTQLQNGKACGACPGEERDVVESSIQTRALLRGKRKSSPAHAEENGESDSKGAKQKRNEERIDASKKRASKRSL